VGGQAAGEQAAETALAMLRARLERETGSPAERVREAITLANNEIYRLARLDPELEGMACVLTVALVCDGRLTVGHVGDTRLYEFRAGGVRKLTHDHSPVGEREDQGELAEVDAMRHPRRNEVFRDVGSGPHNPADEEFIEIIEQPFEADSALLLCSDGLSDLVPSAALARMAYRYADDPVAVTQKLIQAANDAGGKDNITAVFVEGERFAAAARQYGADTREVAGWRSRWRPRLAGAAARARATVTSRPGTLAIGCVCGLALAYAALVLTDVAPDWVLGTSRTRSWSRTWVVGADPGADCATIGAALARAQPGDTVEVQAGEYREAVVLRGDVRLVSQRRHEAVLGAPPAATRPWIAVEIQPGTRGRLAGFRIAGTAERPLAVGVMAGDAEVEIDDLDVSGAVRAGITIAPRSRVVIRSSSIHNNPGDGVIISKGAMPTLLHNLIVENGGEVAKPALVVHEMARPVLVGNIFAARGVEPVQGLAPAELADVRRDNVIVEPPPPARRDPLLPPRGTPVPPGRGAAAAPATGRRGAGGR
ncbi:MAG: protein phosphatase 2C domain-containing protein, partial [Acidobacteria bacterium]|nr:protein phosphatase 2C domain-containing protein [Acidobacteriota bacterium]